MTSPSPVSLRLNEANFRRIGADLTGGTYADERMGAATGLSATTVYRVRTGRMAPGPRFIAAVLTLTGEDKFPELFDVVRT